MILYSLFSQRTTPKLTLKINLVSLREQRDLKRGCVYFAGFQDESSQQMLGVVRVWPGTRTHKRRGELSGVILHLVKVWLTLKDLTGATAGETTKISWNSQLCPQLGNLCELENDVRRLCSLWKRIPFTSWMPAAPAGVWTWIRSWKCTSWRWERHEANPSPESSEQTGFLLTYGTCTSTEVFSQQPWGN